jgi:L-aspartate oxidase
VMAETGADHVYLDGTHLGEDVWEHRFPTIRASCLAHGIDPVRQPIPVVPAAHYASGGVKTDLHGRTNIAGLYACGEAACTGVHGANRLASNSLLEGLVFAERIAADLAIGLPPHQQPAADSRAPGLLDPGATDQIQHLMTERAGVLRSGPGLLAAAEALGKIGDQQSSRPSLAAWEATNLHALASALVASASIRTETRGSHWRDDFPDSSDNWIGHLIVTLDAGEPSVGKARTDTSSWPLQNALAKTSVRPGLDDDAGLTITFMPTEAEQARNSQREDDSDGMRGGGAENSGSFGAGREQRSG